MPPFPQLLSTNILHCVCWTAVLYFNCEENKFISELFSYCSLSPMASRSSPSRSSEVPVMPVRWVSPLYSPPKTPNQPAFIQGISKYDNISGNEGNVTMCVQCTVHERESKLIIPQFNTCFHNLRPLLTIGVV